MEKKFIAGLYCIFKNKPPTDILSTITNSIVLGGISAPFENVGEMNKLTDFEIYFNV